MRTAAPWLLCLLTACQFDPALPATAIVSCAADGRCPEGFACRARLGLCVPLAGQSGEAPNVVSASVMPQRAKHGDTLHVSITVSKPLLLPPQVTLLQATARPLHVDSQRGTDFTFSYVVDRAVDTEGSARLTADLIDAAGTEALSQPLGVVELDFTPPTVVESGFTAPRTGDDAGVLLTRPDEAVAVRVTLSEPVRPTPVLSASSACDGGLPFTPRSAQGGLLDFAASGGQAGCEYALSLSGAVDLAGNAAAPLALSPRLVVDGTAPVISDLQLLRSVDGGVVPTSVFSLQPGFDAYLLRFDVDDSAVAVDAHLDDAPVACTCAARTCSCPGRVSSADREGAHTLAVTVRDAAGNVATGSRQARFDFTAPALVASSRHLTVEAPPGCPRASVTALTAAGTLRLDYSIDEEGTAAMVAAPAALAFTSDGATTTHFAFSATVRAAASPGTVQLSVLATDLVGNQASLDAGAVELDVTAPAPPDVGSASAIVYRRAPWGTRDGGPAFSVSGAPGSAEPGSVVQVLDGLASLATGPVTDAGFDLAFRTADRAVLAVRAFDPACNASPAVDVKNVEWLATLNGKVAGRTFENPHALETRETLSVATTQPGAVEVAPRFGLSQAGASSWVERGLTPGPRYRHAAAFDVARGVLVLFGGTGLVGSTHELWEWSAATRIWTNRTPTPLPAEWPTPREFTAVTYDPLRQRVVLFGGSRDDDTPPTDDLWEWDGATGTWRNKTPALLPAAWPAARDHHALTYDSGRGRVVLFGGDTSTGASAELWELDTATVTWVNHTPAPLPSAWPSARRDLGVAYDAARSRVVLFGGQTTSAASGEVWEWDGAAGTWANPMPAAGPTPRTRVGLAYDAARQRVVLFGGVAPGPRDELWEWDGVTWTLRTPSAAPAARSLTALAYDSARSRVLLVSGTTGSVTLDDLWEWDGAAGTWTDASPASRSGAWPGPLQFGGVAYDGARRRFISFGGDTNSGANVTNEVWEWDGEAGRWTNRTPSPLPTAWPARRRSHGVAFDSARGRLVSFGGYALAPSQELWEWDGDAGTWANRTPAPLPSPWPDSSGELAVAFDSARARVVLFGGGTFNTVTGNDWAWNGADGTFAALSDPDLEPRPAGRKAFALAYDSGRSRLVLFGGQTGLTSRSSDVWEWSAATSAWVERTPPSMMPQPTPRRSHALAYDPARGRVLLFGGDTTTGNNDELWEWDGASWQRLRSTLPTAAWPPARSRHSMAYDTVRSKLLVFGGFSVGNPSISNDLWEWGVDVASRPALVARFNFSLAGAETTATVLSVRAQVVAGGSGGAGPVAGVDLLATKGDVLSPEQVGAAPEATPSEVTWQTSSPARLASLFEGPERRVSLAVTPRALNAPSRAGVVRLDWAELVVRYRLP